MTDDVTDDEQPNQIVRPSPYALSTPEACLVQLANLTEAIYNKQVDPKTSDAILRVVKAASDLHRAADYAKVRRLAKMLDDGSLNAAMAELGSPRTIVGPAAPGARTNDEVMAAASLGPRGAMGMRRIIDG